MGTIRNVEYIKSIGIKHVLCHTSMGNMIYILNNGQKYKEFGEDYRSLTDATNKEFKRSLEFQTEEHNHQVISYPEIVISSEQELFGIVGNYEDGISLIDIDPLTSIDFLLNVIKKLEESIRDISLKGWNLEDLHEENILINIKSEDKPVRIIDTDYHVLQQERDRLELYKVNMKRVFSAIMISVLPAIGKSSILKEKDIATKYLLATNGIISVSEFLNYLLFKLKISVKTDVTIKTLQKSI